MTETVFISGADKGLGFSLVRKFLKSGFQVFAGAYSSASDFSALVKKFPQMLNIIPLDVTNVGSVREAARKVSEKTSSLDILINVAGVHIEDKNAPLEKLDFTDMHLEQTMDVNAFGPLRVTQQFLSLIEKGQRKLIINISSEAGSISNCWRKQEFAYCMSKTALNMQSKLMQNCLGPKGIKILAVHPGWMRTDMGGKEADISSDEAAEGIFELAVKTWDVKDAIYMDYKQKLWNW